MRNFLAFVGAAVVIFFGLGAYLGWYKITPEKTGPGQSRLQVDINQEKIGSDVKQGVQKGSEKLQEFLDKKQQNGEAKPDAKEGANLDPPSIPPDLRQAGENKGASPRAKEAFRDLIIDGWFSGEKK